MTGQKNPKPATTREGAIRMLFVIWVVASTVATLCVSVQMIAGGYGSDGQLALNWLLGQFTPVLSILLAAVFSEPTRRWREANANPWRFRWSLAISGLQITLMIGLLLCQPFFTQLNVSPFTIFDKTQAILSILQGVATAAVGSVIFDGR